jgi:hypothetical protein
MEPPLFAAPLERIGARTGRWLAAAGIVVVTVASAVLFTPYLRFSGALHGDEPKYIRYVENFYQGHGFDVSKKRLLTELTPADGPRVLDNVGGLVDAIVEEATLLSADARRFVGLPAPPRLVARPGPELVFSGKHAGTVYQLHNPGLSFLLFPGYYVDRRLTGAGVGYRGEFPESMPAVHATLLALYAGYALALYGLLAAYSGNRVHAWILAVIGTITLPAGAFAFQIYPEIAAGLVIFVVVRQAIRPAPSALAAAGCGLLAGFLLWLHVRFGLVTLVLMAWMLTTRTMPSRSRLLCALACAATLGSLSLYMYRSTGSLLPTAAYGGVVMSPARILYGVPGFALDREWGLLAHSPVFLVGLAGAGLAWSRRPVTVMWIAAIVAAAVIPAAGHGFQAGGATPGRYIVAVAPLPLLFAADAMRTWARSGRFVALFVLLALASVETAVRYNLHHLKHVGPLVPNEFSGWRFNLLFPSIPDGFWPPTRVDAVLLVCWLGLAVMLVAIPAWRSRRALAREGAQEFRGVRPLDLSVALAAVLLVGTTAGMATGRTIDRAYMRGAEEARERALTAFAVLPRCAVCLSSAMGAVEPTVALGNLITFVDLRARPTTVRAGQPVEIRVRPRSDAGEFVVSLMRLDLGDGETAAYPRVFGDIERVHVYEDPGDYTIHAWVRAPDGEPIEARLPLRVEP